MHVVEEMSTGERNCVAGGGRRQRKIPPTSQFGQRASLYIVLIPSSDIQTSLVNLFFARVPENSWVISQF